MLGATLFRLTIQTEVDTELADAISAFRAALEVRGPERNRRDWATSRNNLASALRFSPGASSRRTGSPKRLQPIATH